MKTCGKCKAEKPTTEFSKCSRSKDGLQHRCKACYVLYRQENKDRILERKAEYCAANRDRIIERSAEYYALNKNRIASRMTKYQSVNSERIAARKASYYLANKDRIAAKLAAYDAANKQRIADRKSAYYAANKDRFAKYRTDHYTENRASILARQARYAAANPEKISARNRNRRARDRNADGSHSAGDVRRIFKNQRGLCANCHSSLIQSGVNKFHVDHITPLARGGSNWPSNLQLLCPQCNLRKNAKDPIDWARKITGFCK